MTSKTELKENSQGHTSKTNTQQESKVYLMLINNNLIKQKKHSRDNSYSSKENTNKNNFKKVMEEINVLDLN